MTIALMRIAGPVVIRNGTGRLVIDRIGGVRHRGRAIARIVVALLRRALRGLAQRTTRAGIAGRRGGTVRRAAARTLVARWRWAVIGVAVRMAVRVPWIGLRVAGLRVAVRRGGAGCAGRPTAIVGSLLIVGRHR
jgi:hypothetical protein